MNISQVLLTVTPGPTQPADLESFLQPIAEELNSLAQGFPGVAVAGSATIEPLKAYVLQFTTDMPAGDKLMNPTGRNGRCPNRFRDFSGVLWGTHYYFPPVHPSTGATLFSINASGVQRRPNTSFVDHAAVLEKAIDDGRSAQYISPLATESGCDSCVSVWACNELCRATNS